MQKIGMAGIGLMGQGIAGNIIKNGYSMVLLEHPGNQPLSELIAAGATTTPSASLLAAAVDVVILCLTGSPEVEDVLYRRGGLLEGLKPGLIVVDCSTAIPSSTVRIAEAVNKAGGFFLDAAMTRTPKEAAEGRLNLIVGGDKALFDACRPIMDCYAENIVLAGPVGSGHRLKLLHNFVSLGFSAVLAEAAACAERAGVDAKIFADVLAQGGGASVVLDRLRPYIESRDGSGFRFTIANAQKDMTYYTTMAREAGAARSGAEAVRQIYAEAAKDGPVHATVPELMDFFAGAGPAPVAG